MPNIADAIAHIQAAGLPVLFVDTCMLLDVIRAPLRPAAWMCAMALTPREVRPQSADPT